MLKQLLPLDPQTYQKHHIHGEDRVWAETNCYVDLWIELLHAYGHEPDAALAFTLGIDFEGDQWTFFKFPLADIYTLYGMDVQELAIWKPVVKHVEEQVGMGRPVLIELDAFYLPDTAGTAYQLEHVKTTVAVNEIDIENRQMGYFHNQGYFHLEGENFSRIFHLDGLPDPAVLPPYVELVKQHNSMVKENEAILAESINQLTRQLTLLPAENPFHHFKARFNEDLGWLMEQELDIFHKYSFATLRQYGACFELATTYLHWLAKNGQSGLEPAITAFSEISNGAKTLQFQLARAINRKRKLDLSGLDQAAENWDTGMDLLRSKYL